MENLYFALCCHCKIARIRRAACAHVWDFASSAGLSAANQSPVVTVKVITSWSSREWRRHDKSAKMLKVQVGQSELREFAEDFISIMLVSVQILITVRSYLSLFSEINE